jgi:protease-4
LPGISDEYTVINYPEQGDPFQEFLEELGQNMETKLQQYYLGDWAQYADYKKQLESMQGLQMRLPYEVKID